LACGVLAAGCGDGNFNENDNNDNGGGGIATRSPTPAHTSSPAVATTAPAASATPSGSASGGATPSTSASGGSPNPSPSPSAGAALCGNGVIDGEEDCDPSGPVFNADNLVCFEDTTCTCEDFCNDAGGTLGCNANCTLNFSQCTAGGCSQ